MATSDPLAAGSLRTGGVLNRSRRTRADLLAATYGFLLGTVPIFAAPLLAPLGLPRRPDRYDALWWGAAAVVALAEALHGGVPTLGLSILLGSLLWRASARMSARADAAVFARRITIGISIALALASALAAIQLQSPLTTRATSWIWPVHANLVGHQLLALLALVVIVETAPGWRIGAILAGAPALALSGSRAAMLGLAVLLLYLLTDVRGARWRSAVLVGITLLALLAVGIAPLRTRLASALELIGGGASTLSAPTNLFRSSEQLDGPAWDRNRVRVTARTDHEPIEWLLEKQGSGRHQGVRQSIRLRPEQDYAISGEFRPGDGGNAYGLFGQQRGEELALSIVILADAWQGETEGPLDLLRVEHAPLDGGWVRLETHFRYLGEAPVAFRIGPVVDWHSTVAGSELTVRALQLELGDLATPYRATDPLDWVEVGSRMSAIGRLAIWRVGADSFLARPLIGWGSDAFPERFAASLPNAELPSTLPNHAHNLVLSQAFERGTIGLIGLLSLLAALALPAIRARDTVVIVPLAALLLANVFDATLLYTGVLYPLALAVGWRVNNASP